MPLGKRKRLATNKKVIKDEDSGEDSEEAKPLAKRTRPAASYKEASDNDSEDNGSEKTNNRIKSSQSNRSSSSLSDGADDSSDSDVPLAKKKAPSKPALKTNGTSRTKTAPKYKEESSDSDSDTPLVTALARFV